MRLKKVISINDISQQKKGILIGFFNVIFLAEISILEKTFYVISLKR